MPPYFSVTFSPDTSADPKPSTLSDTLKFCREFTNAFGKSSNVIAAHYFPKIGLDPKIAFFENFQRVYVVVNKTRERTLPLIQQRSLLSKAQATEIEAATARKCYFENKLPLEEKKEALRTANQRSARMTSPAEEPNMISRIPANPTRASFSKKKAPHQSPVNSASSKKIAEVAATLRSSRFPAESEIMASSRNSAKIGVGQLTSYEKLRAYATIRANQKSSVKATQAGSSTQSILLASKNLFMKTSMRSPPLTPRAQEPKRLTTEPITPEREEPEVFISREALNLMKPQVCLVLFCSDDGNKTLCLMVGPMKNGKFIGQNKVMLAEQEVPDNNIVEEFRVVIGSCKPNSKLMKGSAYVEDFTSQYFNENGDRIDPDYKVISGFIGRVKVYWARIFKWQLEATAENYLMSEHLNCWTDGPLVLASYHDLNYWSSSLFEWAHESAGLANYDHLFFFKLFNGQFKQGYDRISQEEIRLTESGKQTRILWAQDDKRGFHLEELGGYFNTDRRGIIVGKKIIA